MFWYIITLVCDLYVFWLPCNQLIGRLLIGAASIPGTAAVAVSGIIASMSITGRNLKDNVFVFQGAGEVTFTLLV